MHIDKMIRKEIMGILLTAVILLTVFIGVSFAVFFSVDEGEETVIQVGDIELTFCKDTSCNEAYSNFGQIIGTEKDENGNSVPSKIYPFETTALALETTPYIFYIENTGELKVYFSAYLEEDKDFVPSESYVGYTSVTELYSNHIKIGVGECADGVPDTNNVEVYTFGELTSGKIIDNVELEVGDNKTYCVWTWLDETTPNEVQETYFVANLNFTAEYKPYKPWYEECDENSKDIKCTMLVAENGEVYADNVNSTYVKNSPAGINFGEVSSDTNGKGLYYTSDLSRTEDIDENGIGERVYYYRGAVENNYLIFANYCWRVVRTNEDGSVKLRYGGVPTTSDGITSCPQTGEDVNITTMAFNSYYDDVAYSGYMYPNTPTESSILEMDNDTLNKNESDIKQYIDDWYDDNLVTYEEKIADTIYCADRTIAEGINYYGQINTKESFGKNIVFYGIHGRLLNESSDQLWKLKNYAVPQYLCERMEDSFAKDASIGNGKLENAIGLITIDEASYAGGLWFNTDGSSSNDNYYLYTGLWYWTISPAGYYIGSNSRVSTVDKLGHIGSNPCDSNNRGVVPAISLKASVKITNGTGVYNNPYIVE